MILFDMDGVVANFTKAAMDVHKKSLPYDQIEWNWPAQVGFKDATDPAFWEPLGNTEFWANLPVMEDGFDLFKAVENVYGIHNIAFLSDASAFASGDGKMIWLKKYFPEYQKRVVFTKYKDLVASPDKLLIDDNDENVRRFDDAGGKAIVLPRPWNRRRSEVRGTTFDHNQLMKEIHEARVNL